MIFRVIILSLVVCLCLAEKPNVDRISSSDRREIINLAVVACGDRAKETLVLLKSALMFTRSYLHFIIITEKTLKINFIKEVTLDFARIILINKIC